MAARPAARNCTDSDGSGDDDGAVSSCPSDTEETSDAHDNADAGPVPSMYYHGWSSAELAAARAVLARQQAISRLPFMPGISRILDPDMGRVLSLLLGHEGPASPKRTAVAYAKFAKPFQQCLLQPGAGCDPCRIAGCFKGVTCVAARSTHNVYEQYHGKVSKQRMLSWPAEGLGITRTHVPDADRDVGHASYLFLRCCGASPVPAAERSAALLALQRDLRSVVGCE